MPHDSPKPSSESSGLADIQTIAAAMEAVGADESVDGAPAADGAFVVSAPAAAPSLEFRPAPVSPFPAPAPAAPAGPAAGQRRALVAGLAVSVAVLVAAVGWLGLRALGGRTAPPGAAQAPRLASAVPEGRSAADRTTRRDDRGPRSGIAGGLAGAVAGAEVQRALDEDGEEDEALLVLDDLDDADADAARRPVRRPRPRTGGAAPAPADGSETTGDDGTPAQDEAPPDGIADPFAELGGATPSTAEGEVPSQPGSEASATEPPAAQDAAAAPAAAAAAGGDDDVDVDCLVDRTLPKCAAFREAAKKRAAEGPAQREDEDLPEKLSMPDVRAALRPVKQAARSCAKAHAAPPGTKVRVKLSIEGATGLVVSATPLGEHADSPLGKCVASKFGSAKFPRFRAKRMGLTYPIVL